jgi:predicted helicase
VSRLLLTRYRTDLDELARFGGAKKESSIRAAFQTLLDRMAREKQMRLIPELEYVTKSGKRVFPDGTVKDDLRLTHGYWEAKDEYDKLPAEISKKLALGYPTDNIIFEDTLTAVLYQDGSQSMQVDMFDEKELGDLLDRFFSYQRPEIQDFRRAVKQFKADLPHILMGLRNLIDAQYESQPNFKERINSFLTLCRQTINPELEMPDMREMLIQHILTEELFLSVFTESHFHRENNIAKQLTEVENTFFTGAVRRETVGRLKTYYAAIRRTAANTGDFLEKQNFLKAVYENFYRVYNPKAADRLGVIYTPNEIVRFMIDATETVLNKQFGRILQDKEIEILDPATGTGTFITTILEHFRPNVLQLEYKYRNELHCNETAILPYYIANLNIEYTFEQIVHRYEVYPNICFVDTLENLGFSTTRSGQQTMTFALSSENVDRIENQNSRRISVIIGNPPYRANQKNENENNKNRTYPNIDLRIRETYVADSSATKTKAYDMYIRFFRWASDRIADNGIISFITNRSFIDSKNLDGFRKNVANEFSEIYIVDLGGDVRANPKLSGPKHNVFGIQTGVAISLMIRRQGAGQSKIFYARRPENELAADKLSWLAHTGFEDITFEHLTPDDAGNWLHTERSDFDSFVPLADRSVKATSIQSQQTAIFKLYSLGISTNRDEWVYDFSAPRLLEKMSFFIDAYDSSLNAGISADTKIKWSRNLKRRLSKGRCEELSAKKIVPASYRPFCRKWLYDSDVFIDEGGSKDEMFPVGHDNISICFSDVGSRTQFCVLAVTGIADLHFGSAVDAYQQVPLFRFDKNGRQIDNITDWALDKFRENYREGLDAERLINKRAIFHYCYAVLHDPQYRTKYARKLKRNLPRIPFYSDFWKWADLGARLMNVHIGYDRAKPWPLERIELEGIEKILVVPPILKSDRKTGRIVIDKFTTLAGVPEIAWRYGLGSRSAIDWVLDQYKLRRPRDLTLRNSIGRDGFADYKEQLIELIMRVVRVSVETQKIIEEMSTLPRIAE